MGPELRDLDTGAVDIDAFGVVGDNSVVGFAGIIVLDHVIPEMPFPDDRAAVWFGGGDLDEVIGEHVALGGDGAVEKVRVEPGGDDLGNVLALELLEEQGGALGVGVDANCAVLKFGLVFCCLDGQGGALVSG